MKHIKLFEAFVNMGNYSKSSVKFNMPDLYEMPTGLDRNKVYVVKLTYECENLIYALMDYSQLEKTYELLNLNLISEKIRWYSQMIYPDLKREFLRGLSKNKEMFDLGDPPVTGDFEYAQRVLARKSWSIRILAEAERNRFPYYVYVSGGGEAPPIMKKLEELTGKCKVCGDDPDVVSALPGQITCDLGSNDAVFDPGMEMKLSDIIYDDSGTHESPEDDDHMYKQKGYYIRFDSLGAFLAIHHPAHSQFDRFKKVGDKFVVDNSKIFEVLPYKPDLVWVRKYITGVGGVRDFLDDIFAHLIDVSTPVPIINAISDILNPDNYQIETIDYCRVEIHNYIKRILSWKTGEISKTPDFKNSRFFLALPNDRSLVDAILNKLPKNYGEISDGLDSMDRATLQKYRDEYPGRSDFPTLDSFKEMLKSIIYLVEKIESTKQKINLYDGKLPSADVLKEETHCHFFYGISNKITIDKINRLSPIELYMDVFYNGKNWA